MTLNRCPWPGKDPLYIAYHDTEWGVPVHDDRKIFEFLLLEGAQAGLSWITILRKRENYRKAFDDFDPAKIACYGANHVNRLMSDPGIIRNRRKIESAINNAGRFLEIQESYGSFSEYMWRFVDGKPLVNRWENIEQLPCTSPISESFSRDLKKNGFTFVGPVIMYSHMQAVGMVNDHLTGCFRHGEITLAGRRRENI